MLASHQPTHVRSRLTPALYVTDTGTLILRNRCRMLTKGLTPPRGIGISRAKVLFRQMAGSVGWCFRANALTVDLPDASG